MASPGSGRGGPGWRRFRARGPGERFVEADAAMLTGAGAAFRAGARCFHHKSGMGTVAAVDGDRLSTEFDNAGHTKVVAPFLETTLQPDHIGRGAVWEKRC